jgi:hypothetical protein
MGFKEKEKEKGFVGNGEPFLSFEDAEAPTLLSSSFLASEL